MNNTLLKSQNVPRTNLMNTTTTGEPKEQTCENVKVVIRCRPMSSKEAHEDHLSVVQTDPDFRGEIILHKIEKKHQLGQTNTTMDTADSFNARMQSLDANSGTGALNSTAKRFTFDNVYDESSTQEQVYNECS